MYCVVTGANDEECKDKAKKYFESQIRSLGWGRMQHSKKSDHSAMGTIRF